MTCTSSSLCLKLGRAPVIGAPNASLLTRKAAVIRAQRGSCGWRLPGRIKCMKEQWNEKERSQVVLDCEDCEDDVCEASNERIDSGFAVRQQTRPWVDWSSRMTIPLSALVSTLLLSSAAGAAELPGILSPDYIEGGYISAFLLILFSEIGDKTFFIAVLLSLQNSRSAIFTGTFSALAIMTVISVLIGQSFHQLDDLIPESFAQFPLDDVFAAALLIVFGVQTLLAAKDADDTALEEQNEAQEVVSGLSAGSGSLILSTFGLVFAAEWGDKSFLATAALAAASSPVGVCLGAVSGHAVATIIAVLGGSFLSKYISEKDIQYIGGSLFLVFAFATLVDLYTQVQS